MKFKPKRFNFDKIKKRGMSENNDWGIRNHMQKSNKKRYKDIVKAENRRIKKILSKGKEIYTYNEHGKKEILLDMIAFGPYVPDIPVSVIKEMLDSPKSLAKFFGQRERAIFGNLDNFIDYLKDGVELVEIYEKRSAREKAEKGYR